MILDGVVFVFQDALEGRGKLENANFETCFLKNFPKDALLQSFAQLQSAAWKGPETFLRRGSSPNQQDVVVLQDDRPDSGDWHRRVCAAHTSSIGAYQRAANGLLC